MAEPRKVFRIEETAATSLEPQVEGDPAVLAHAAIMHELGALRSLLAPAPTARPGGPTHRSAARSRGSHPSCT